MRGLSLLLFLSGLWASASSYADVSECVDQSGRVVLTDAACPEGFHARVVVPAPLRAEPAPDLSRQIPRVAPVLPAQDARGPERTAAELERLNAENARLRDALQAQRLDRVEQRLDALGDWSAPQVFGTFPVPVYAFPHRRPCAHGKCGAAKPPRPPQRVDRPDGGCGTFGCTPSVTRTPWDRNR